MAGENDQIVDMTSVSAAAASVSASQSTPATKFTDSPEQARVVNASGGEDMLVVAGAGSGKTYTMTRRIINLIRHGVPPERILGLTFTRKAASELLGRVSAAVADSGAGGATARSGARAFLKPEVLTYDAFFQSIVRRYGLLVGFDQSTQPLSAAGAWQLAVGVVDEHMDSIDPKDFGGFKTLVKQVLALANAIGGSMIGRSAHGEAIGDVNEAIARVRSWDAAFADRLKGALEGEDIPQDEPKPGKLRKRTKKESDEDYELRRREYRARWHALSVYRTADLAEVVRKREVLLGLVQAFNDRKRQLNMAEFSDFTVAAYALVTRFPSIGERLRRQYTHVLLDEYQDTSTTQASLLAALFHPQGSGDKSGRSAVSAVGDPFQSIYAWRGASPGAFRLFIKDFGLSDAYRPYPLSVTRRNSRVVLEAANNLTLPLRLDPKGAKSSSLMREVSVAPLDTLDSAPLGTLGVLGYETMGQEIDAVARFAKAAIARHANDGNGSGAHVAVLFRSKTAMPAFAEGLESRGLTCATVGYSAMLERADVRDVLALLHAVADHTDSASLMRLLATPRFGVGAADLEELAALAQRRNDEYRFRALVQAGLADAGTPAKDRHAVVSSHRDQVPNISFLTDLMCDDGLDKALRHAHLSHDGAEAISRAGAALREVQTVVNRPLVQVIKTAVEALDLDVDTVVAQAMRSPDTPINPSLARSGTDALISLVDTYTNEIAEGQAPSLQGFVGWVDSLDEIPDDSAASPDDDVDVVLMTIHQSKGLEWDAVAVVGLKRGGFPSNQGDSLKIDLDEDHMGSMHDGVWQPPEYIESARTWLDNPAAVPAPVRVDSGILPRFPHDADPSVSAREALAGLDDVESITDETEGLMRGVPGLGEDASDSADGGDDADFLPQSQEYGRRLHADERRLAYVALTRAREEVLITYSRSSSPDMVLDPDQGRAVGKPSNFWEEILDSVRGRSDAVSAAGMLDGAGASSADEQTAGERTLAGLGAAPPEGVFVGEHADEFCRSVVFDAWNAELPDVDDAEGLAWPASMSRDLSARLNWAADQVRQAGRTGEAETKADQVQKTQTGRDADTAAAMSVVSDENSLLAHAQMLLADRDLAPQHSGSQFDQTVRGKGERLLASRRQNVTSLQARAGRMDEHEARRYWRSLVRPIPSVSSPAAQAGTRFHAWAERFINAYASPDAEDQTVFDEGEAVVASGSYVPTRAELLADLEARERGRVEHGARTKEDRHIDTWCRRLVDSRWASRRPFAAERQIVVAVDAAGMQEGVNPQEEGDAPSHSHASQIINGKLDAVFYGGLDESDRSKKFTVVDWKTGRKPVKGDDVQRKLAQLDMYRLLLSAITDVPLAQIDATLYYLSEPKEVYREIHAEVKTQAEILAELSDGTVEGSDND